MGSFSGYLWQRHSINSHHGNRAVSGCLCARTGVKASSTPTLPGGEMKRIADLLFEARMLKEIPRSGFQFLGAGRESVAEHVYAAAFIAYVMTQLHPDVDALKLISM